MNKYQWSILRKTSEKTKGQHLSSPFSSPLPLARSFFLSIGENRESLFYKHWLLEEGRKDRMREEKYPRRKKNQFSSLAPANHVNSALQQHWSKKSRCRRRRRGRRRARRRKIMNTNTSFCMQIDEKKSLSKRCASAFVDQIGCSSVTSTERLHFNFSTSFLSLFQIKK